ncbi:MAG: EamA family transporter [Patescibacteria group bacterium]
MIFLNFTTISIISAFFAAIANIMARTILKDLKAKDILAINFFTMGAVLLILSPFFYKFTPSPLNLGLLVLIALIDTVANYFYFQTFEKTSASIASPLLSLAPGFTFLFGWLLLSEPVNLRTILLCLIILILVILFSVSLSDFRQFKKNTLWPALLSSLLFGLSAIPSKFLLDSAQAVNAPTLYMFRACFIALFSVLFFKFTIQNISIKQYRTIFFRGLFVIAQWILLYWALSKGSAGVTLTLGNITPIFVFILSIIFLKEKPTLKKLLAAGLVLVLSFLI